MHQPRGGGRNCGVAPHAGAWIEIMLSIRLAMPSSVAPHAGAWIEMSSNNSVFSKCIKSLPTRERGLKSQGDCACPPCLPVAPHAGAWIEISLIRISSRPVMVAPHAGAWIEMTMLFAYSRIVLVAPHAGAWIETSQRIFDSRSEVVAPHAGAWIEIPMLRVREACCLRSLPTRERGLKYVVQVGTSNALESLPTRERGLKCSVKTALQWC